MEEQSRHLSTFLYNIFRRPKSLQRKNFLRWKMCFLFDGPMARSATVYPSEGKIPQTLFFRDSVKYYKPFSQMPCSEMWLFWLADGAFLKQITLWQLQQNNSVCLLILLSAFSASVTIDSFWCQWQCGQQFIWHVWFHQFIKHRLAWYHWLSRKQNLKWWSTDKVFCVMLTSLKVQIFL